MSIVSLPQELYTPLKLTARLFIWSLTVTVGIAASVYVNVERASIKLNENRNMVDEYRRELDVANRETFPLRVWLRKTYGKDRSVSEDEQLWLFANDIRKLREEVRDKTKKIENHYGEFRDPETTEALAKALRALSRLALMLRGANLMGEAPGESGDREEAVSSAVDFDFLDYVPAGYEVADLPQVIVRMLTELSLIEPQRFLADESVFRTNSILIGPVSVAEKNRYSLDQITNGLKLNPPRDLSSLSDMREGLSSSAIAFYARDIKHIWNSTRQIRITHDDAVKETAIVGIKLTDKTAVAIPQTPLTLPLNFAVTMLPVFLLGSAIYRISSMRTALRYLDAEMPSEPTRESLLFHFRWLVDTQASPYRIASRSCGLFLFLGVPIVAWLYAAATTPISLGCCSFVKSELSQNQIYTLAALAVSELIFLLYAYIPTIRSLAREHQQLPSIIGEK